MSFQSTKLFDLGSCCFRQFSAKSHCRFQHGYFLRCKIHFSAKELDERGWVVDFGCLKPLKLIFEDQFDHKFVAAKNDPELETFKIMHQKGICDLRVMDAVGIEKTAEWCYHAAQRFVDIETKGRCWVSKVEVWEHALNSAIYKPDFHLNDR